ncbi:MAG: DNA polymerase III subunit gamma/tau [Gammaproteobacteria bacterium]
MSYLALARRYRPRNFEEVVGQAHVLKALANALEQGRLHHAYLFSGTRGVGKTTIARILARCLNCEKGVSAHPCGECGACKAIEVGRFVDLIEVDAASRTKVEDTRDLLENVSYAPAMGRYKVYLIDEVHMLSGHSFNALLKTLEEPPEHVKFLFATTEPEKLPLTVLSRCLVFTLQRLPSAEIEAALAKIVTSEGLAAEPAALAALAQAARGSVRDALSLLDQALAFGGDSLTAKEVASLLGTADRDAVYDLLDLLAAGDGPGLLARLAETMRGVADADDLLDALAQTLALLARYQLVPDAPLPTDATPARLEALAHSLTPEAVQLDYDIAIAGKRDLAFAPDPVVGLEMVLLRMLAFRPEPVPTNTGDRAGGHGKLHAVPAAGKPAKADKPAKNTGTETPAATATGGTEDWESILARLDLDGMTREFAQQCSLVARDEHHVKLALDARHRHLLTPRLEKALEKAIKKEFGDAVGLVIKVADGETVVTPAAKRSAREAERQARAEQAIADDPHVAALRETFAAEIIPDTIRPEDD